MAHRWHWLDVVGLGRQRTLRLRQDSQDLFNGWAADPWTEPDSPWDVEEVSDIFTQARAPGLWRFFPINYEPAAMVRPNNDVYCVFRVIVSSEGRAMGTDMKVELTEKYPIGFDVRPHKDVNKRFKNLSCES